MFKRITELTNIKYSWKRFIYTICFCTLCVIDQRTKTCTGLDGWLETFRNMTGLIIATIIISHYHIQDFRKYKGPYLLWMLISLIGGSTAIWWGSKNRPFINEWIAVIFNVVIWGIVIIHTSIQLFVERKIPKLNKKRLALWIIMMLLMIVSRSTYIWPACYFIMFLSFYFTDFTKGEIEDIQQGMLDGIIIAFFLFQALCCVFRPYDVLRYQGLYHNPNMNALFYLEVFAAVLIKVLTATKNKASKGVLIFYWLGTGVLLAFLLMTIGRTAWIVAIILSIIFAWAMRKIIDKKCIVKTGIRMILCTMIMLPICFCMVRYIPPIFHHPIWFWGEWGEYRVHSWDPWNSPKYIDADELFEECVGRIVEGVESTIQNSPFMLKTHAQELDCALTIEQARDSILVRKTIYKYYIEHLNLWGHPYSEQGFRLIPNYWIGHAHNIYLQYGTDFGVFAMIVFMILMISGMINGIYRFTKTLSIQYIVSTMFLAVIGLYGMLEYAWGTGSLSTIMMFVAWGIFLKEDKQ